MGKARRVLLLSGYLAVINWLLYFLGILLLGGSSDWGKVEAGHYFLGNHGEYVEVAYLVYIFSWLQSVGAVLSIPFILLNFASSLTKSTQRTATLEFGLIFEAVERVFSWLFDAWRKPNVEFFTSLTKEECVRRLEDITSPCRRGFTFSPTWLYIGITQFDMADNSQHILVLHGQLTPTLKGTHVRAWHRFSTIVTLFIGVFGAVVVGILIALGIWSISVVVLQVRDAIPPNPFGQFGLLSVISILSGGVISLHLGAFIGKRMNKKWEKFLAKCLASSHAQ